MSRAERHHSGTRSIIAAKGASVPRDRSTFRQGDLTKAFKAAKKAGVDVRVEVDLERKRMTITPVNTSDAGDGAITAKNDWDSIYDQN